MLKSVVIDEKKFKPSPWAGADNPLGPIFYVNMKASSLWSFVASLKRIFSASDFVHIFSWFNKCIFIAGQGQTTSCHFGHLQQVSKNVFEVWFYTIFFMILYMYIAPGQGLTTPWGRNFDVNRNILSLWSFVLSFKKRSLKSDFIQFFLHDFIYFIYIVPGQGQTVPKGKSDVNRNVLSLHSVVTYFKHVFEVWFYKKKKKKI